MEHLNNYPVVLLRQRNQTHKSKHRKLNRRARNRKTLRKEIYSNHNVFQSDVDLYRNMTAQNILWDKKYDYQRGINQLKEANSSLKARIWNVEKENRRMERQIEAWGLTDGQPRPYVDTSTRQKVLSDQDYSIVSLKLQIIDLERELEARDQAHQESLEQNRQSGQICAALNHEIARLKVEACGRLGIGKGQGRAGEQMASQLAHSQNQLSHIAKNMDIKRKTKNTLAGEIAAIGNECQSLTPPTHQQLDGLWEEIRGLQVEKDGGVQLEREKYEQARKKTLAAECAMQGRMGEFIKAKLTLHAEIGQLRG